MVRVVTAVFAAVVSFLCVPLAAGAQPGPTVSVAPDRGTVETMVTATGSTCALENADPPQPDTIELVWDGTVLTTGDVDPATGTYTATFAVPGNASLGDHEVMARCVTTGATATTTFTVVEGGGTRDGYVVTPTLSLDPVRASDGDSVTARGRSCGVVSANSSADEIELYWSDDTLVATGEVDPKTYEYTATFTVPRGAAPGEHRVAARCVTWDDEATTVFTVVPPAATGDDEEPQGGTIGPGNTPVATVPPAGDPATAFGVTDTGGDWPSTGVVLVLIGLVVLVLLGILLARSLRRARAARPGSVTVRAGVRRAPAVTLTEKEHAGHAFRLGLRAHRDRGTYVLKGDDR